MSLVISGGRSKLLAEKSADAFRVAIRRIEECEPARVGPTPHRAAADPFGGARVKNRYRCRIGAEQPWSARLLGDFLGDGHQQIKVGSNAAAECLRRDVDTRVRKPLALPLAWLVLDVLVTSGLDDRACRARQSPVAETLE